MTPPGRAPAPGGAGRPARDARRRARAERLAEPRAGARLGRRLRRRRAARLHLRLGAADRRAVPGAAAGGRQRAAVRHGAGHAGLDRRRDARRARWPSRSRAGGRTTRSSRWPGRRLARDPRPHRPPRLPVGPLRPDRAGRPLQPRQLRGGAHARSRCGRSPRPRRSARRRAPSPTPRWAAAWTTSGARRRSWRSACSSPWRSAAWSRCAARVSERLDLQQARRPRPAARQPRRDADALAAPAPAQLDDAPAGLGDQLLGRPRSASSTPPARPT